jgi:hypothetical protein
MELLPYQSLRDLVRKKGPLTPARGRKSDSVSSRHWAPRTRRACGAGARS